MLEKGYKSYENEEIIVYWNPSMCEHAGECVRNSNKVFRPKERPWIHLDEESGEKIARTIDKCPSKALLYELK